MRKIRTRAKDDDESSRRSRSTLLLVVVPETLEPTAIAAETPHTQPPAPRTAMKPLVEAMARPIRKATAKPTETMTKGLESPSRRPGRSS